MGGEDRIDFLVGGVQKGGTTALHAHLADLPSVRLASVKEAHFFDDESVDWSGPDYAPYHALFPPKDARPAGEVTPIYLYWPQSLERIARYRPDIRLVFLFRDPVERAWSQWKMEYARGWETEPFAWAIRQGRARVDSAEAPGHHRVYSYVERGFYGAQLERLLGLFPREQLLFLKSDDLKHAADTTVRRVCRFIGAAEPQLTVEARRELVSKDIDYGGSRLTPEDCAYLRALYREDTVLFGRLSGLDVAGWL
jgi:hypothetical protein